jgi:hypothetical protein
VLDEIDTDHGCALAGEAICNSFAEHACGAVNHAHPAI